MPSQTPLAEMQLLPSWHRKPVLFVSVTQAWAPGTRGGYPRMVTRAIRAIRVASRSSTKAERQAPRREQQRALRPSSPGRALVPAAATPLTSPCPREQRGGLRCSEVQPQGATPEFFTRGTKSFTWPPTLQHADAPNSPNPVHISTPWSGRCLLPGMPLLPLSTWHTAILQTERLSPTPPPIMSMAPSPGLFPSQHSHQNWGAGSPLEPPTS